LEDHAEENDTAIEDIDQFSAVTLLIFLQVLDFRGHLALSTQLGEQLSGLILSLYFALGWSCKPKICNLEIIVIIDENIFALDVSVAHSR